MPRKMCKLSTPSTLGTARWLDLKKSDSDPQSLIKKSSQMPYSLGYGRIMETCLIANQSGWNLIQHMERTTKSRTTFPHNQGK